MAKNTILVVDDEKENIDLLKLIFDSGKYQIACCSSGKHAIEYLTKNYRNVAMILLDYSLPVIDGLTVLKVLHKKGITKIIPVVMMPSERSEENMSKCYENGATDVLRKPLMPAVVKGRVNNLIDLFETKNKLQSTVNVQTNKINEQSTELKAFNDRVIEVLSTVVEFRNLESGEHIKKIKKLTRVLAEMAYRLYPEEYNLNPEEISIMESASALHDIGKIAIMDSILLKPGRLTEDEFEVIKSHTTLGCEILDQIEELQDEHYMEVSRNICRHHHERYDGKGYPDGLVGEDIPIEAQIVAIADAYDALVGSRIYRDAFDKDKAFKMIMNGECGVFSDNILTCFEKARPLLEKIEE